MALQSWEKHSIRNSSIHVFSFIAVKKSPLRDWQIFVCCINHRGLNLWPQSGKQEEVFSVQFFLLGGEGGSGCFKMWPQELGHRTL